MHKVAILVPIFLLLASSALAADSLPILLYHGIEGTDVSQEVFRDQMAALKAAGYHPVSAYEAINWMQGNRNISGKPIMITFDDGRRSSFYQADPILKEFNFHGTMYLISRVNTRTSAPSGYLNKSEVRTMIDTGRWDIQAHANESHTKIPMDAQGNTGPYLVTKRWLANESRLETQLEFERRMRIELDSARSSLREQFNVYIDSFAFPYGAYGQNPTNYPEAKGILLQKVRGRYPNVMYQTFTGEGFSHNHVRLNEFMSKRITVQPTWNGTKLIEVLKRGETRALPYSDALSSNKGWERFGGTVNMEDGSMVLRGSGSSAAVFLDGTHPWKDYNYSMRIHGRTGAISMLTRFQDRDNYAICEFSDTAIRLLERNNSVTKQLASKPGNYSYPDNARMSVRVTGNLVSCAYDNTTVTGVLKAHTTKGGIGVKVAHLGSAFLQVAEVNVA